MLVPRKWFVINSARRWHTRRLNSQTARTNWWRGEVIQSKQEKPAPGYKSSAFGLERRKQYRGRAVAQVLKKVARAGDL
ncbi:MAG: hypothetical protein L6R40_000745 [Gallowayella cf. fulva]|nr:MAG: hypothetical protein L6R40_000745 [Xanthomendoza cf. fulva]